jgi:putative endonuclease
MTHTRQAFGQQGERLAAQYLQQRGCALLAANWRCPHGEIDLIMQQGETLVFVEVKTRRSATTAPAFTAITPRKRQRLIAAAQAYLAAYHDDQIAWRVDAVAVAIPPRGQPIIEHVEDALDW